MLIFSSHDLIEQNVYSFLYLQAIVCLIQTISTSKIYKWYICFEQNGIKLLDTIHRCTQFLIYFFFVIK